MSAATKQMTLDDYARFAENGRYEFVDGALLERKMSNKSSGVGGRIFALLLDFSRRHGRGSARPDNTAYRCFPGDPTRVRKPDVSWIAAARWSPSLLDSTYIEIAPDLVVEVVSPNDRAAYLRRKVKHFFEAGTQEAWIVFPDDQSVERHFPNAPPRTYSGDEPFDASPLIPGFTWKLADVLE